MVRRFALPELLFLGLSAVHPQAATVTVVVPTQLQTEQTVFLANGGAPALDRNDLKGSEILYTSTYQALASIARFHMVASPGAATLALVVSLRPNMESQYGSTVGDPLIHLEIYDVKSHMLLWVLDDPASDAFGNKQFQKAIDDSMRRIVSELNTLGTGKLP